MTTPPPGGPGFPEPPTQRIPQALPGAAPDQPTQHLPQPPQQYPPQAYPPGTQPYPPQAPQAPQTPQTPQPPQPAEPPAASPLRDPISIALVLVIVAALALAGLIGGELYARNKADSIVAKAVSCVVRDSAKASFGIRPFLLQHFTGHYRDMRVETAGNQLREAKGMQLTLRLDDVRMHQTADSAGTLGSLDADINWTSEGIKQTVSGMIPLIGSLVSGVSTSPADGTIEVDGPLGTVTIKPTVTDGDLKLDVLKVTGLGMTLPRESAQPALDVFTGQLTKNLPMGIHADSVTVTDSGVQARFITRDATIPNAQQDPCFAGL